jgi:MOSC domain-containing protein YiiM
LGKGARGARPCPLSQTLSPNPLRVGQVAANQNMVAPAIPPVPDFGGLCHPPWTFHNLMKNKSNHKELSGRIVAVSVSHRKGEVKHNVAQARLLVEHGLEGDAHAEGGIRQVSLLAQASIDKMVAAGADVHPGDFAENLTVEGISVMYLPVGTRLKVGDAVQLEVTQIGKKCHAGCAIRELIGDCVMPREGIFARVITEGLVKPGDAIQVIYVPGGNPDGQ